MANNKTQLVDLMILFTWVQLNVQAYTESIPQLCGLSLENKNVDDNDANCVNDSKYIID